MGSSLYKVEVKPKGNAMTQKCYSERLLPVYINAIHKAPSQHAESWILQEGNDPSHGTRKSELENEGILYVLQSSYFQSCWPLKRSKETYMILIVDKREPPT